MQGIYANRSNNHNFWDKNTTFLPKTFKALDIWILPFIFFLFGAFLADVALTHLDIPNIIWF